MSNTIKLTETEVEFLYSKVKLSNDFPKDLLTKLEEVVNENRQKHLEEYQSYSETLKKFNSDTFLQKVYKTLKDELQLNNYNPVEFMNDIKSDFIEIFNTEDEWFEKYTDNIYEINHLKSELRYLVKEEICEEDRGKTILHKLLKQQLELDSQLFLIDNKIVVCYF